MKSKGFFIKIMELGIEVFIRENQGIALKKLRVAFLGHSASVSQICKVPYLLSSLKLPLKSAV